MTLTSQHSKSVRLSGRSLESVAVSNPRGSEDATRMNRQPRYRFNNARQRAVAAKPIGHRAHRDGTDSAPHNIDHALGACCTKEPKYKRERGVRTPARFSFPHTKASAPWQFPARAPSTKRGFLSANRNPISAQVSRVVPEHDRIKVKPFFSRIFPESVVDLLRELHPCTLAGCREGLGKAYARS